MQPDVPDPGPLPDPGEVTQLLHRGSTGDRSVEEKLFSLVLPDLRRLAGRMMAHERSDHSLQATALMNEAYFRIVKGREREWESRRHLYAVAARAMRYLLIDHARANLTGAKIPIADLEHLLRGRDSQLEVGPPSANSLRPWKPRIPIGFPSLKWASSPVSRPTRLPKLSISLSEPWNAASGMPAAGSSKSSTRRPRF